MSRTDRRRFLQQLGASAAVLPALRSIPLNAQAAPAAAPAYDVVIVGGRVIDPAQKIDGVRDVAINGGRIARVDANIGAAQGRQSYDAKGKIVSPGFIDVHGHVYDNGIPISIDPDQIGVGRGVTTIVDGGSTGASSFPGFKRYVIDHAQTRVLATLNISTVGLIVTNEIYLDPAMVNVQQAVATIKANPQTIVGIKVRINGKHSDLAHDIEVLKKARQASDESGVPIMMHWTNEPDLIALLKRGDILTHPFNPDTPNQSNLVGGSGSTILPIVLSLKEKGILTDFSHGGHLQWSVAETAAKAGWFPDTLSTDIHRSHVPPNGIVVDLATTMSKFMYLGLPVDQAIEKVTAAPARMFKFAEKIGTLEVGAVGDVTISELRTGDFEYSDTRREKRTGHQRIVPLAVVKGGKLMATTLP